MIKILDDIINIEVVASQIILEKIDTFFEYLKLLENYVTLQT